MAGSKRPRSAPSASGRPVDIHVGRRVGERRRALAMSRAEFAEALGMSQEQVRRYESGLATIVASRLYTIGQLLGVPASHFFDGLAGPSAADPVAPTPIPPPAPELRRLLEAFWTIGDDRARRALLRLIETIADSDAVNGPQPTR